MINVIEIELVDLNTGELVNLKLDPNTNTSDIDNLRDMLSHKDIEINVLEYKYVKYKEN